MYKKSEDSSELEKIIQDLADLGIKVIMVAEAENEKLQGNSSEEAEHHQKIEMIHRLKAERDRLYKHWKEVEQEQKIRADSIMAIDKALAKADKGDYLEVIALVVG